MNGITPVNLGWWIVGVFVAGLFLGWILNWFGGQYEVSRRGWRLVVCRRWYGVRAHVRLRGTEDADDPDRYVVLGRDDENLAVPWLKVHKLNPHYVRYWDEDSEAFWAPVTDFAPVSVRRFRPGVIRFSYLPLRQPSRYLDGAP